MFRNNKGMTLLEIMIVLVILGGLAAVLANTVMGRLKKANMTQAKIQIGEYGKALDNYKLDCGSYPQTEPGLKALVEATSCTNWGPDPYVKKVNPDPWGREFVYEATGDSYVLKSLGSDGQEGGSGEKADISSENL